MTGMSGYEPNVFIVATQNVLIAKTSFQRISANECTVRTSFHSYFLTAGSVL